MKTTDKQSHSVSSATDDMSLNKIIGLLFDEKWLIISVTSLFIVIGVAYAILATPIYKADALIQVEDKSDGGFSALVGDMGDVFSQESTAMTEIGLMTSRMILGKTVDKYHLQIVVKPNYFPIIGKGIARLTDSEQLLTVTKFEMPDYAKYQPHKIVITDAKNKEYQLIGKKDEVILTGKEGEVAHTDSGYTLLVSALDAEDGFEFDIAKRTRLNAINWLNQNIAAVEKGKQTGLIRISYQDADPAKAEEMLNDIADNYFLQNVERDSAEAEQSIQFLKEQLPKFKEKLTHSEDKLNDYRQKRESVDLNLEAQSTLNVVVDVESQLNALTFKEAEISKKYKKTHPAYKALLDKRHTLLEEKAKINKQVKNLPETQREVLRLKRDVEVDQQIYVQLLNKIQELNVVKAGTVGNARIVDTAVANLKPVSPKKVLIVVILTLLGGMISVAIVLLKMLLNRGIESPEEIESLGLPVYASIPKSTIQSGLMERKSSHSKSMRLLSVLEPADLSVEALRSLRTSLHFAVMEAENNIVMISGSTPGIGKTFVSTNFGAVCAHTGKKVILIDADMRRGSAHRFIGVSNKGGLAEYLSGELSIEEVIKHTDIENFDVITRGQVPPNPSELLTRPRFKELLNALSEKYQLVLIDTPPVLAVTDASIVGHLAGTSLMVARFGVNTTKDVEVAWGRFKRASIEVTGVVFNGAEKKADNYYYYDYSSSKE